MPEKSKYRTWECSDRRRYQAPLTQYIFHVRARLSLTHAFISDPRRQGLNHVSGMHLLVHLYSSLPTRAFPSPRAPRVRDVSTQPGIPCWKKQEGEESDRRQARKSSAHTDYRRYAPRVGRAYFQLAQPAAPPRGAFSAALQAGRPAPTARSGLYLRIAFASAKLHPNCLPSPQKNSHDDSQIGSERAVTSPALRRHGGKLEFA